MDEKDLIQKLKSGSASAYKARLPLTKNYMSNGFPACMGSFTAMSNQKR